MHSNCNLEDAASRERSRQAKDLIWLRAEHTTASRASECAQMAANQEEIKGKARAVIVRTVRQRSQKSTLARASAPLRNLMVSLAGDMQHAHLGALAHPQWHYK